MGAGSGRSGSTNKATKKKSSAGGYVSANKPSAYTSALANKIKASRNALLNWSYDPMQDANYQALAQVYAARGNQAAQDTLGDAAALNGGFGTSYAVSAAQQARNQYNQELASLIPELEQNAYSRAQNNYGILVDRDNELYSRYRDRVGDYQWAKQYNHGQYQFKKNYALDKANLALDKAKFEWQKKNSSGSGGGGGGGRRRSSGGGYSGGYSSASGGGLDLASIYNGVQQSLNSENSKKKKKSSKLVGGGGGHMAE